MSNLRPSVEQLRDLGNFTQMFRWGLRISKFPEMLSGYTTDQINFRCESHTVPEKAGETVEITIRGNTKRQAGKHTYNSPLTMVLVDTVDQVTQNFLHDWSELCWQSEEGSTGITQNNEDIEATVELYQLNNLDEPIRKYTLIGVTLETSSKGDFDGSTSDPMKPSLQLFYDYFNESDVSSQ